MNQEQNILTLDQNLNYEQTPNSRIPNQVNIISTDTRQNLAPIPVLSPANGDVVSRLMNTKMVRIHSLTKCACNKGCKKPYYQVNTISRIDDINRENEQELPLFEVEENQDCCKIEAIKFDFVDATTNQLFSASEMREFPKRISPCCDESYIDYPFIYNYKLSNRNDYSHINQYDSRSFYRTYNYSGQSYYKIGEPYVPKETTCGECCCDCITSLPCCICCRGGCSSTGGSCCSCFCCCCNSTVVELDKRTYIDIYNMTDQSVGKFVEYCDISKSCCSNTKTLFYEIYFPFDANDLLRLTFIGQMIFFLHLQQNLFGALPGSKDNLEQFII